MSSVIIEETILEKKDPANCFKFFTPDELKLIDLTNVPKHIAIIPDGNRRWAKKAEFQPGKEHAEGADILIDIVKSGKELGVKTMTIYVFSTENWSRERLEIDGLMFLLQTYLIDKCEEMVSWGIKFNTIGDLSLLPKELIETIAETKKATSNCQNVEMVLAINYGSRDELCRTVQAIAKDYKEDKIESADITEKLISNYLDTRKWQDPELLIRTSGEMRISNFLLWQLSYTEIYVTNVLWPDYRPSHLLDAIYHYQKRQRRLGGS